VALRLTLVGVLLTALLVVSACGDSGESQENTSQAPQSEVVDADSQQAESTESSQDEAATRQVAQQIEALKQGGSGGDITSCGEELYVGPGTPCEFASNVRLNYYNEVTTGTGTVRVLNPKTKLGLVEPVHCTGGSPHICTRKKLAVYFP
jgi:hypothetical protein